MFTSTATGVSSRKHLCKPLLKCTCKLELITKLRKHGVMIMRSNSAQMLLGLIKGFAEPIKGRQGEQEMFESARCNRKSYITQADKEGDANCCN